MSFAPFGANAGHGKSIIRTIVSMASQLENIPALGHDLCLLEVCLALSLHWMVPLQCQGVQGSCTNQISKYGDMKATSQIPKCKHQASSLSKHCSSWKGYI